jgi:hypothetical protein
MIRTLLIPAAVIGFSASAFAQTAAPKGGKPVKQLSLVGGIGRAPRFGFAAYRKRRAEKEDRAAA